MKVIALEEHYCPAELLYAWKTLPPDLQDPGMSVFEGGATAAGLKRDTFDANG